MTRQSAPLEQRENLCDNAVYTGYQINGGFAEYAVANANYCFPIPENFSDSQAAPLLCAGSIGYRAYRPAQDAKVIGLYGFGAAAHILVQVAKYNNQIVYALTRPGDVAAQEFALKLGADSSGSAAYNTLPILRAAMVRNFSRSPQQYR